MGSVTLNGIVYLVGAGPGDPGLLTRRGAQLLRRADVVLFDRLVHPDVLELARNAQLVDVGKRPGESGTGQERINALLVEHARAGKVVVRLKGGDPFVFGRGGEEAQLLAVEGVPFEIVPGVTSAIAGPAYAGIPLTHRAHASWAAIATGHEDPTKEDSALDWDALARAPTAVFLMGLERIGAISDELRAAGRRADTPAAVISWATWPQQRVVRSTLEKIAGAVEEEGITSPAVLVVGDVVSLDELDWIGRRPLHGLRVFVTRTRAQAGKLSELLREAGSEPLEFPAIKIVPPESYGTIDGAIADLERFAWIVFSSTNAVDAFWERLRAAENDSRALAPMRVAAIGPATAEALQMRGIVPDLVPPTFTSESLTESLGSGNGDVLVPGPQGGPTDLADALMARGWTCTTAPAYRTVVDDSSVERGKQVIDSGVDAVLFTSGSTVRNFVELWGVPPESAIVCCIGPRTAEAAQQLGVRVDAVAAEAAVESLVSALVSAVRR